MLQSLKIASKYIFFYNYITRHKLPIKETDLKITEEDIKKKFPDFDNKKIRKLMFEIHLTVFDGLVPNEKEKILEEIENGNFDNNN